MFFSFLFLFFFSLSRKDERMPKHKNTTKGTLRHQPLAKQIIDHENELAVVAPRTHKREKLRRKAKQQDEGFVPKSLSNKAIALAREQRDEENDERKNVSLEMLERADTLAASSDEEDYNFDDEEEYEVEEIEMNAEDVRAMELWMGPQAPKRTLADLIMEKIREKEEMMATGKTQTVEERLDPKIVQVYRSVGELLRRYKSGKLPKAFKIIPSLANWEEIVYLTDPDRWTPQAVRAATKIFASNLNAKMAQRFYNIILLPRIREDIEEHKKLNWHFYMALKKSVFKPSAFYKGIILPLCESRTCTLREATIIGSIMVKCSIPSLHSAVALLKIAEMEYSGGNSIFIRILLDKKYALPYRVVDSLVTHFSNFMHTDKYLPVLWHQSLLVFVQRYKELMTQQQKETIRKLVKAQCHRQIAPEIHRELQQSKSRGDTSTAMKVDKPRSFMPFG